MQYINTAIDKWDQLFEDLADGKDIKRWRSAVEKEFIPVAIKGFTITDRRYGNQIHIPGVLSEYDKVNAIIPAVYDSNPDDTMVGADNKAKFRGRVADGVLILIDTEMIVLYKIDKYSYMLYRTKFGEVSEIHEVKPTMSFLSMTSAGSVYEALLGDSSRILFRIALEFKRDAIDKRVPGISNWAKFYFELDLEKITGKT
jgi:hypothetical protein